jgi:subtilisin family serine protease
VINLSLGGTGPSSVLADAINYAHSKGVIVVAAAGNTGGNFVLYPARYPNVIAVAKTNNTNNWDGSNYGPEVDLAAPGASIYSTTIGGYDYKSGSSMASGYTSGLAAILKGIPGNVSPDAIELQMESTALDIEFTGWDEYTGAGLIQMDSAIQLALPTELPPGEQSSPSVGGGAIPGQVPPTNTPIPTWTVTPTLPTQTKTATFTPETQSGDAVTGTPTSTLTEEANEVETQSDSGKSAYTLPCLGIIFILLGMLLGWFYTKKTKRP